MRALAVVILVAGFILGGWATAAAEGSAPAERPAKVTGDRVNLRGSPSTTGEKVGSLVRGDAVTILEEQGEWYRVRLEDGQTGWAAGKFIQVLSDAPTETSKSPTPEPSHDRAKDAVTPRAEKQGGGGGGGGGGSFIGSVFKWGCLVGAGACGYLAYSEHTKGNDSYEEYKTSYSEPLRQDSMDHDQKAQTYAIAAGGLGAAFLVQQLFFGGDDDQAALETGRPTDEPPFACGLRQGQLRAAVTLARF